MKVESPMAINAAESEASYQPDAMLVRKTSTRKFKLLIIIETVLLWA